MSVEAEVKALRRQNRRLKLALLSTFALLVVFLATAVGFTTFAAARARAEQRRALEMSQQARAKAEALFEEHRDQAELDKAKSERGELQ